MRLKLTLQRPDSTEDVLVTLDAAATVGDLADALLHKDPEGAAGAPDDATICNHGAAAASDEAVVLNPELPVIESGLRSGSRVSLAPRPQLYGDEVAPRGQAVALLRVMSGPGAGREFPLFEGANYLGRDTGNDVVLSDPLISKRHARLSISSSIDVVDLGSANGVFMDGVQVQRATLTADDVAMLGDTAVAVLPLRKLTGAADPAVDFNRPPLVRPVFEGTVIDGPEAPDRPRPFHLPLLSMLAPLFMGLALFFVTKSINTILFMALSPLLIVGSMWDQHRQGQRETAEQKEAYDEALVSLDETLATLQHVEVRSRLVESPSTAEAVDAAERLSSILWLRRPDLPGFMTVRMGLGRMPSRTVVAVPARKPTIPGALERLAELVEKFRYVDDVPVVGDFKVSGGLGIAGPDEVSAGIARSLALQLACLHSPSELAITAVGGSSNSQEWDWLKWLPHVNSGYSPIPTGSLANSGPSAMTLVSELEGLLAKREATKEKSEDEGLITDFPVVLAIVMEDAPVERSRLVQLAEKGPSVGIFVMWVAGSITRIPACCRAFVDVKADGDSMVGLVQSGESVVPVVCETADLKVAGHVARRLAPVVDSGARLDDDSDLPRSVSWLAAVGADLAETAVPIIDRWKAGDPTFLVSEPRPYKQRVSLRGAVGQAGGETYHLDLRTHGPHALVGGTTGAGKSEFLQSWVLGMAAEHSPKRLTFLFVDYKGGSAFANCLQLPHCVGLVTDLSPYLVRRALASFRAELRYRERILEHKGAKDLIDLERSGDPDAPPSLLIIVDEFAALVNEVPEFIDGVVDVGQRGRSLGLHLVLATQQPSGVIKGSLRANTNLRVALRMADVDDSMDVIGDKMAGGFDPTIPGRGAVKTGPGRITQFQSLYCGGVTPAQPPRPAVDLETLTFGNGQPWSVQDAAKRTGEVDEETETDIARVVAQINRAAQECQVPTPRKPWLDTLAATYELARLEQRRDNVLVLGVEDDPDLQEHRQIAFRPDEDGNMAIFGTGGSGKSTVLRTLALTAAVTPRSGPCNVYGLDFGSRGLSMLEGMPHVGAIISGDDHERIARLFRWLREEIETRSKKYAAVRAGTITEYRKNANQPDEPRILLLIDSMANFRQEYEISSRSAWFTIFGQICSDGRPVGVHVVMTGDRPNAVPPSIGATVQQRVILRLADEQDYAMVNAAPDIITADSPPGRCIFNGLEAQIATLGGSQSLSSQSRAVERLAEVLRKRERIPARRIESLAERVSLAELPVSVDGGPAIGVRDDLLAPIGIKPAGTFLIIGPPASGRTTAIATLVRSTYRAHPGTRAYFFGNKRSQVLGLTTWVESALDEDAAMDLAMRLETDIKSGTLAPTDDSPVLIVMDNVSAFFSGMAETSLQMMVVAADAHDIFVLAEGETSTLTASWALGTALRARRRGFALQPDDMDGTTIFRTTFPRMNRSEFPPGRGILVDGGKMIRVQLALPD